MQLLTFIQLHYLRSVGRAHIMEDAIFGVIFLNTFPLHMPMALTMNNSKAPFKKKKERMRNMAP